MFRRARIEEELDDELRFYVDVLAEEKIRSGMTPDEARRAARVQFGGIEQVKELVREVRPGAWLESLWRHWAIAAHCSWPAPKCHS